MDDFQLEEIEDGLREALRPVPAPEHFTDRVMARVVERHARERQDEAAVRVAAVYRRVLWTSGIAAMFALTLGGGAFHVHSVHEQQRAAQAQAQVDFALQLTGHALDQVQDGLDRSSAGQILNSIK